MLSKALLDQLQAVLLTHDMMYQDDNVGFTDVLDQYKTAVKAVFEALNENWQYDAVVNLLETPRKEVEPGRVYTRSHYLGETVFHMVDRLSNGIQIEQIDVNDKWDKRVTLYDDEVTALAGSILSWHLAQVKQELEYQAKKNGATPNDDDSLGSLDDHPF